MTDEQGYVDETFSGHLGYHKLCYQKFTNRQHIERAQRAVPQPIATSPDSDNDFYTYEPPRKLRSTAAANMECPASTTLPDVCIICKRTDSFVTIGRKRARDRLVHAETLTAGQSLC